MGLPKAAEPLISRFSIAFTRPTFQRVIVLILGAIMATRHRTVTGILRAAGALASGHWSDFHRVLSLRVWSNWPLGRVLASLILELLPSDQPVVVLVDDTTPQHKGKHVYGKGCHHDAIRSTHSHTRSDPWYAKKEVTFSDAIASVRRLCWCEVLEKPNKHAGVTKLPRRLRLTLLDQLCRVA